MSLLTYLQQKAKQKDGDSKFFLERKKTQNKKRKLSVNEFDESDSVSGRDANRKRKLSQTPLFPRQLQRSANTPAVLKNPDGLCLQTPGSHCVDVAVWSSTDFRGNHWVLKENLDRDRKTALLKRIVGPHGNRPVSQVKMQVPLDLFFAVPCINLSRPQELTFAFRLKESVTTSVMQATLSSKLISDLEKDYAKKLASLAHMEPNILLHFPAYFQPQIMGCAVNYVFHADRADRSDGSNGYEKTKATAIEPAENSREKARKLWLAFCKFPDSFCYYGTTLIPQKQIFRSFPGSHVCSPQFLLSMSKEGSAVHKRLVYMSETFHRNPSLVGCPVHSLTPVQQQLIDMKALVVDANRIMPRERLIDENKCHVLFCWLLRRWPLLKPAKSRSCDEDAVFSAGADASGASEVPVAFFGTLNNSQRDICRRLHRFRGLAVVQGQGGTGKTFTITTAFRHLLQPSFAVPEGEETPHRFKDNSASARAINFFSGKGPSNSLPQILFLAPTHKATRKLQADLSKVLATFGVRHPEASASICKTIHHFVFSFKTNVQKYSAVQVFVVDEASMVDNEQMGILLDCLQTLAKSPRHSVEKIVLMGDSKQLMPVNAGNPFKDLITFMKSSAEFQSSLFELHRNMRTGQGPLLDHIQFVRNACDSGTSETEVSKHFMKFRCTNTEVIGGKNLYCVDVAPDFQKQSSLNNARQHFEKVLPLSLIQKPEVQVICQRNIDADAINSMVQQHNKWPRVPKVSNLQNGMRIIVGSDLEGKAPFGKGDVLEVERVIKSSPANPGTKVKFKFLHENRSFGNQSFEHVFSDTVRTPDASRDNASQSGMEIMEEFTASYAYAFTVHKAQGASIDRVIFVFPFNTRGGNIDCNMMYTAASRAKEGLTYVGKVDYIASATLKPAQNRYSELANKLKQADSLTDSQSLSKKKSIRQDFK